MPSNWRQFPVAVEIQFHINNELIQACVTARITRITDNTMEEAYALTFQDPAIEFQRTTIEVNSKGILSNTWFQLTDSGKRSLNEAFGWQIPVANIGSTNIVSWEPRRIPGGEVHFTGASTISNPQTPVITGPPASPKSAPQLKPPYAPEQVRLFYDAMAWVAQAVAQDLESDTKTRFQLLEVD